MECSFNLPFSSSSGSSWWRTILKSPFLNLDSWTVDIWEDKKFPSHLWLFFEHSQSPNPRTGSGLAFECLVSYLGFQKTVSHGVSSAHGGVDSMCCLWVLGMTFSCIENQQGNGKSPCFKRRYIFKRLCFPFSCYVLGGVGGCICFIFKYVGESLVVPCTLSPFGFLRREVCWCNPLFYLF